VGNVMTGDFLNVQWSRLEPAWRRRRAHLARGEKQPSPAVVMEMERGWRFALFVTTTGRDPNFTLQLQISSGAVTVETVAGDIKYVH
jgi:hypothetical protein